MSRVRQPKGSKGSLQAIQWYVNEASSELDRQIQEASRGQIAAPINWRSPLNEDEFAEYSDRDFLSVLGVELSHRSLEDFWPTRGPQWDALGTSRNHQIVLVEAKAHIPEIISPGSEAGEASLKRIRTALQEVANGLSAESSCDWTGTFYQYTNRLAHLYLLRELNQIPAWLVQVCFINDERMNGPKTVGEWRAATDVLKGALGLRKHRLSRYMIDVFPDARAVTGTIEREGAATA